MRQETLRELVGLSVREKLNELKLNRRLFNLFKQHRKMARRPGEEHHRGRQKNIPLTQLTKKLTPVKNTVDKEIEEMLRDKGIEPRFDFLRYKDGLWYRIIRQYSQEGGIKYDVETNAIDVPADVIKKVAEDYDENLRMWCNKRYDVKTFHRTVKDDVKPPDELWSQDEEETAVQSAVCEPPEVMPVRKRLSDQELEELGIKIYSRTEKNIGRCLNVVTIVLSAPRKMSKQELDDIIPRAGQERSVDWEELKTKWRAIIRDTIDSSD
jgi:hypothetical protein